MHDSVFFLNSLFNSVKVIQVRKSSNEMGLIGNLPKSVKTILIFNSIQLICLSLFLVVSLIYEAINITKNVKFSCKLICFFSIALHIIKSKFLACHENSTKSIKNQVNNSNQLIDYYLS